MRILILGGTAYLSAAVARQAIVRGHQVSCLARGTACRPPAGANWIRADRDGGPEAYRQVSGQDWDAVIDVAMQPIQVRQALDALADRTGHWTFVSSVSVYSDDATPDQDESGPLHSALSGDRLTELSDFGPAKVACEQAVQLAINSANRSGATDRMHISRPGLIGGPGDRSDRFGYWPARFARRPGTPDQPPDDVLVPDIGDVLTQVIDVDDLAGWLLDAASSATTGILNAVGDPAPFDEVVQLCRRAAEHHGTTVPIPTEFLVDHGAHYWAGPDSLPLWLPAQDVGFGCRSNRAARAAGMRLRPLAETVRRSLQDERRRGLDRERKSGLAARTEERLLNEWRSTRPEQRPAG